MKYVRTAGFLADLRRLPLEHRKMFRLAAVKGETVVIWLRVGSHSIYGD